jgi:hypothetical protein
MLWVALFSKDSPELGRAGSASAKAGIEIGFPEPIAIDSGDRFSRLTLQNIGRVDLHHL